MDEDIKIDSQKASENPIIPGENNRPKIGFVAGIKNFYETQYKKLLIIPFALLLIALIMIGVQVAKTGDFINRDVSLKGGVIVTIPTEQQVDVSKIKEDLLADFPNNDIATKSISKLGRQIGII